MKESKTCIIIAGPTAVGKTGIAVSLARELQTEIISADSRQCYRELNIGVAKPSKDQLAEIPHYFINTVSIQEKFSAVEYEKYALKKVTEIFTRKDTVILVGGTGLYLKAFSEGMDEIPEIDNEIRNSIRKEVALNGIKWVQNKLLLLDEAFSKTPNFSNPQRCMRALEVVISTGNPIGDYQLKNVNKRPFNIKKILLQLPTDILYERINSRVDVMIDEGLVEEATELFPYSHLNALNTVGYKEVFDYLDGKITKEDTVNLIKRNTRRYAKRQNTWFRNIGDYTCCPPDIDKLKKLSVLEEIFKT